MTIETAALVGMGIIALWGLAALLLALKSAKANSNIDAGALRSH